MSTYNELLNILNQAKEKLTKHDVHEILRAVSYSTLITEEDISQAIVGHSISDRDRALLQEYYKVIVSDEVPNELRDNLASHIKGHSVSYLDLLDYLFSTDVVVDDIETVVVFLRAVCLADQYVYGHGITEYNRELDRFVRNCQQRFIA